MAEASMPARRFRQPPSFPLTGSPTPDQSNAPSQPNSPSGHSPRSHDHRHEYISFPPSPPSEGEPGEAARLADFATGLIVAQEQPYQVLAVGELVDCGGRREGEDGYSNQAVMPGDTLLRIDSRPINVLERMHVWADSDTAMLGALFGPEGSDVSLAMMRHRDGTEYHVHLKRHVQASKMGTWMSLPTVPTLPRSRPKGIGGVGVAVRRLDTRNDQGPVVVHRVNEFSQMCGKVAAGDRLVSVNSEGIDHLPMRLIHALIDGLHGTRVCLEFEHVEDTLAADETMTLPSKLAMWEQQQQGSPAAATARITKVSLDVLRQQKLPLSKAVDADDWVYKKARQTPEELKSVTSSVSPGVQAGPLDFLTQTYRRITKAGQVVGLRVTTEPPHRVVAIDDLRDVNFVPQGEKGYANIEIKPGDKILSVDGHSAEHVTVQELHNLLDGEHNSAVEINLMCPATRKEYSVRVLRHFQHEFDSENGLSKIPGMDLVSVGRSGTQQKPVGILQVVVSAAKNLPHVGLKIGPGFAGVVARVTCCQQTFSSKVVENDASTGSSVANPVFRAVFEFPLNDCELTEELKVELWHTEGWMGETPFGFVALPKAASFVSENGAQDGWYTITPLEKVLSRGTAGKRQLVHLHVSWHQVPQPLYARDWSEMWQNADAHSESVTHVSESRSQTAPQSITSKRLASVQNDINSPQISHRGGRGKYCLHWIAQCAALPHGERCRIPFASINDEFLEEERYEAFAALSAVLKLKERVQTLSGREQQLEIDLKEAVARERLMRAESETNQLQHAKEARFLQGGIRDLSEVLQRKDEMIRALKEQMMEIELQLQRSKAEIDRQGGEMEQMQQNFRTRLGEKDETNRKLEVATKEVSALQRRLEQSTRDASIASERATMQAAGPWATRFEAKWSEIRETHAGCVSKLRTELDRLAGPRDTLHRILNDLNTFLPEIVKMFEDADRDEKEAERDYDMYLKSSSAQRINSYVQTLESHVQQRHEVFVKFRRRIENADRGSDGWKQHLEQEIIHLQEHVERVNEDLVSLGSALRDSLALHDDANNLVNQILRTKKQRVDRRRKIMTVLREQHGRIKIADIQRVVDGIVRLLTENHEDVTRHLEEGDFEIQRLVKQTAYSKTLHSLAAANVDITKSAPSNTPVSARVP